MPRKVQRPQCRARRQVGTQTWGSPGTERRAWGSRAWGGPCMGRGASCVEPDTQWRQVSHLKLPAPRPAPRLALASHPAVRLNPPPSPLPGQSPTWQGGCTHLILSYSLVFPGAGNLPAPPPPLPRRNSEKLERPGYSPPLPQQGAAGGSSWKEGTQESGIRSFEGMLGVQGPEPQKRGGGLRNNTGWAGRPEGHVSGKG